MKTRRFDFNFKPLQVSRTIAVDGSVPARQTYDAESGLFTPDYTLTPLIIQPRIGRMDKDEILTSGSINHLLANVRWYEIIDGTKTLIETTNADYEITASGKDAGRIKVKKNAEPQHPITLEFYAEYTDSRTGQLYVIQDAFPIMCRNSTALPELFLDAADQTIYDPLIDVADQTVTASLKLGTKECAVDNRLFVWELLRDDGTWSVVGAEPALDYCIDVATDGLSAVVHRDLMGESLALRCRAKYDPEGNPATITLNDGSPCKVVEFVRRIHKYDFDIVDCPVNIPSGMLAIAPRASIYDTHGEIANPERELIVLWYVATNKARGALWYRLIAHGQEPDMLPTSAMNAQFGAVYGIDVKDIGPVAAWEDGDGKLFEDGDGNIILIH